MLETPELSYIGAEESKRRFCVSTIRRDARTGTVSITAAGGRMLLDHSPLRLVDKRNQSPGESR